MSIDDLPTYHCLSIRKRILLQSQLKAAAVNPQTTPYPPTTSEMLGQNNNAIVAADSPAIKAGRVKLAP